MPDRLSSKSHQETTIANAARTARALQRRPTTATLTIPATMTFRLSPYNTILDLSKNRDNKLYLESSKGLKEANLFTRKKIEFDQSSKLM